MAARDPVLIAVLLLAAALRLYGLDHGLPFVYNPDEANIMARALSLAQGLDPEYYLYPSFFFYFLFGVMGGLFVLGTLGGRYESLGAFESGFFRDPTDFYLAGRLMVVVAALATIVLTYRLASKHFGKTAARAAALFIAVAYFHVRDSHYLKHDVFCGLLLILALTAVDRAVTRKSLRSYALAGAALGVSFATHYYMIFLAPAFVACHAAQRGLARFRDLACAGVVSAITFFALSPFVVLRLATALEHMRANRQVVVDRSFDTGLALFPSLGAYARFLGGQGLGYVLLALVVLGYVLIARRGWAALALWGGFPFFFLPFLGYTFFAGRYLNPVLPCFAAAAGLAIQSLSERFGRAAAVALAGLACLQPLYYGIQVDRLFQKVDTRTLARAWILEHVPSGETIALQSYSVPLPQSPRSFRESMAENDALEELARRGKYTHLLEAAAEQEKSYRLVFFGDGDERNRIYVGYQELRDGLGPLRALGVGTIVLREPPVTPPPPVAALFRRVAAEATLVGTISPFAGEGKTKPYLDNEDWAPSATLDYKGPRIEIWSLATP